ncbi:MAG: hypothetical protein LLG37_07630 [Spirochaetia bacterium]|nr:hypothetical protein [Spirochaetia bacterium]
MKGILITAVIIISMGGYLIGMSDRVSDYIEKYAVEKLKEPDIRNVKLFDIKYLEFTAKYEKAMDLTDKFMERYEDSEAPEVGDAIYLKGKILDGMLQGKPAGDMYREYIEKYPEGKYSKKAQQRINELTTTSL